MVYHKCIQLLFKNSRERAQNPGPNMAALRPLNPRSHYIRDCGCAFVGGMVGMSKRSVGGKVVVGVT